MITPKRIEYFLKMTLGWFCFRAVMIWPISWWSSDSRTFTLILGYAGFYAFSTGYMGWLEVQDYRRNGGERNGL